MTDLLARQRARMADPTLFVDAQARQDRIMGNLAASPVNMMAEALQDSVDPAKKVYWLRQITDVLAFAVRGNVPCRDGCSACCHMATMITLAEAQAIAKASGRALSMPADRVFMQDIVTDQKKFMGVACVFLKQHRCSIYADRPHVCRVHYSIDRDSLLCQITPGEVVRVPSLNNNSFNLLAMLCEPDLETALMADIRDFFPPHAGT